MVANNSNEHNFQQKMRLPLITRNVFVGIFEFKMKMALQMSLSSDLIGSIHLIVSKKTFLEVIIL